MHDRALFTKKEALHLTAAWITLSLVIGLSSIISKDYEGLAKAFLYALVILAVAISAKKGLARLLDADVEHEIWIVKRYGLRPHDYFKGGVAAGIIVPLFFTAATLGFLKVMTVLSFEARALKAHVSKRFGFYSYTEMTEWHNAIIGTGGILAVLFLAIVAYFLPFNLEVLARLAIYYAFFNMLPVSKLDGAQIFFGSRILYTALAVITLIFTVYALYLP